MRQTLLLTGALCALLALAACGSKGPLYLPLPAGAPAAASPAAKPQVPADDNKPATAPQPAEVKQ